MPVKRKQTVTARKQKKINSHEEFSDKTNHSTLKRKRRTTTTKKNHKIVKKKAHIKNRIKQDEDNKLTVTKTSVRTTSSRYNFRN